MNTNKITLYLDFDGVLHDDDVSIIDDMPKMRFPGRTLFEWAPILDTLVTPFPDVRIILSTSWVTVFGREKAASFLPPSLQERIIGAIAHRDTRIHTSRNYPRGVAVTNDAGLRGLTNWFAIDNDAFQWPEHTHSRHRLVETDDGIGLSDPAVQDQVRVMLMKLSGN